MDTPTRNDVSLLSQIIQEMLAIAARSSHFDPAALARVRLVTERGLLTDKEAVTNAIRGEDGGEDADS